MSTIPDKPIEYTGGRMPLKLEGELRQSYLEKCKKLEGVLVNKGLWDQITGALPYFIFKYGPEVLKKVKTNNIVINTLIMGAVQALKWGANYLRIK